MKRITLLLFFGIFALQAVKAQHIVSMDVIPAEPTVTDTIKIIISTWFPSGGCDGDIEYGQVENDFFASSVHCMGGWTVICNDTDTLTINPLTEGLYNFTYVLSSGMGEPGECTPGIVPDDTEMISFYVSPPLSTIEYSSMDISAFPNPARDFCTLQFDEAISDQNTLFVFDAYGRTILSQPVLNTSSIQLNTSTLATGLYFLQLADEANNKSRGLRLMKE